MNGTNMHLFVSGMAFLIASLLPIMLAVSNTIISKCTNIMMITQIHFNLESIFKTFLILAGNSLAQIFGLAHLN